MVTGTLEFTGNTWGSRLRANRLNLVLAALGFVPLLANFFYLSWQRPAYQFFPLALLGAAMLAFRAAREVPANLAAGSATSARALAFVSGLLCLAGYALWSPWLVYVSFLMVAVTALWSLGGKPLLWAFTPVLLMLLTILPPPMGLDDKLTLHLRTVAVHVSCGLLDWLGIVLVQDGNTIQLPGKTLFVEEACSGINSFILCNAFCLFWLLWLKRPLWWLIPSLLAISLFVVLGNIIRITICAAVYHRYQLDLLAGWRHETLGMVLLLGYFGLVLSVDQLMVFLLQPAGGPVPRSPAAIASPETISSASNGRITPIFGIKAGGILLAVVGLGVFGTHLIRGDTHAVAISQIFHSARELKLSVPPTLAGWQRVDADAGQMSLVQTMGVHTTAWHFQNGGLQAIVAVDYPLDGFHDVWGCYIQNGWELVSEDPVILPETHEDLHTIRLAMKQNIRHALVFHSVMDEQGNWLAPFSSLVGRVANPVPPTGYRIQLFTEGYAPLTATAEQAVKNLYFQARQALAQQMVEQFRHPAGQ